MLVSPEIKRRLRNAIRECRLIRAGDRRWWDSDQRHQTTMDRGLYLQRIQNEDLLTETYEAFLLGLENLEQVVQSYPKGHQEEKSGFGVKKQNPWLAHVKKYKSEHPDLPFKVILTKARSTYKK